MQAKPHIVTDQEILNFGKHQGKRLIDVPADYLIWIYENNKCPGYIRKYIEDNMDALKLESKNK